VKRKRHRAVYLDLTNSTSELEHEINAAYIIVDTPSFCVKVKKKPKVLLSSSSSSDTTSSIPYSSGHDTDALLPISLSPINNDNLDMLSWDSNVAIACHCCSGISSSSTCFFLTMPKGQESVRKIAKSRATLQSEAVVRQQANPLTFACPSCPTTFTRARNLEVHMCTVHQLFSDSFVADESFPKNNAIVRAATVEELAEHTRVRVRVRRTRSVAPVANRIVSDDDNDEGPGMDLGGVADLPIGASRNFFASFTPIVLPRTTFLLPIHTRRVHRMGLCPAAAGSAAQMAAKERDDQEQTTDTAGAAELITTPPSDDADLAASDEKEDDFSLSFSGPSWIPWTPTSKRPHCPGR